MADKQIGKRIQSFRVRKGLTQAQLAALVGISTNHLSALERGVYSVKLELLIRIVNCIDCTADDILADNLNNGYQIKASRLSDAIEELQPEEQSRILQVIDAMVKI